jgi:cell division control protein 6
MFPILFPNYPAKQIYDILEERAKEAFRPNVLNSDVLEYISDIASRPPASGDIRYALDLLLYSGNMAVNRVAEHIAVEDVRKVVNAIHPSITDEDILNLSDKGKAVLIAIVRSLRASENSYASLREIRSMCEVVLEEYSLSIFEDIEEQIQDLVDRDIVDMKSLLAIGISGLPTEGLNRFLETLMDRIKKCMTGGALTRNGIKGK